MRTQLWTWSGHHFGYREGDELWSRHGRLVGRFYGNEIYGSDGRYLGEVRDGDRLARKTMAPAILKPMFGTRLRGMTGILGQRGMKGMVGGYEDFPHPDEID